VDHLLAPLEKGEAEIVGGSRTCGTPGLPARLDYLSTDAPVLHPSLPRGYVPALSTSNLAMWRRVAVRVGEFDATLATCEDRDFCRRARASASVSFLSRQPPCAISRPSRDSPTTQTAWCGMPGHFQYFLRHPAEERLAGSCRRRRNAPAPVAVLAVLGTGYLVLKNWPRRPDAVPLIPLIFLGQLCWHWVAISHPAGESELLDRRIVRLARRLIPASAGSDQSVRSLMLRTMERFCDGLPENALVLDAGAARRSTGRSSRAPAAVTAPSIWGSASRMEVRRH